MDFQKKLFNDLFLEWSKGGRLKQPHATWAPRRESWIKEFPDQKLFIEKLPLELDREALRNVANLEELSFESKFIATMIWGYGDRGYGPYRVSRILGQSSALHVIEEVYQACRESKPLDAYRVFQNQPITGLGPSFGTKFISFMTTVEQTAPILDSLVAKWLVHYGPDIFKLSERRYTKWDIAVYEAFCSYIAGLASQYNCHADLIEQLMFESASKEFTVNSGWLKL